MLMNDIEIFWKKKKNKKRQYGNEQCKDFPEDKEKAS